MTSGDTIGPYRLLALLGKGAMGEVWRARDQRLDRMVALKLLPPDLAGDPGAKAEAGSQESFGKREQVRLHPVARHAVYLRMR